MLPMTSTILLGAIAGDMIGSRFEHSRRKDARFTLFKKGCRFTDDTVLTLAVADALLSGGEYGETIAAYARCYPDAGYGSFFRCWMREGDGEPYNSFGNGSAMRVSPVGWAFDSAEAVLREAERTAVCTHNHPEGVKGAQAVALAIFLARTGASREAIRRELEIRFGYNLHKRLDEIRPDYGWDSTCPGSVPQSLIAFLESDSVEGAIRNAISLGGDADTMAAIAGSVSEAFHGGLPETMIEEIRPRLPLELWKIVERFNRRYQR